MTIYSGSTQVKRVYSGSTEVHRVFSGSTLVWPDFYSVLTVGNSGGEWGFRDEAASYGSLSDASFFGATIKALYFQGDELELRTTTLADNSFERILIGDTVFMESDFTFSAPSGFSVWKLSGVTPNPFGTTAGATLIIKAIE